jgi:hypothetical protein
VPTSTVCRSSTIFPGIDVKNSLNTEAISLGFSIHLPLTSFRMCVDLLVFLLISDFRSCQVFFKSDWLFLSSVSKYSAALITLFYAFLYLLKASRFSNVRLERLRLHNRIFSQREVRIADDIHFSSL